MRRKRLTFERVCRTDGRTNGRGLIPTFTVMGVHKNRARGRRRSPHTRAPPSGFLLLLSNGRSHGGIYILNIQLYINICVHAYIWTYVHVCIYMPMCMHVYACKHVYIYHIYICPYSHTYTYIYTYIHIYMYIHIYINVRNFHQIAYCMVITRITLQGRTFLLHKVRRV